MIFIKISVGNAMRLNLRVPFAEKDEAKKLGARWDPALKVWYVVDMSDSAPFLRWSPSPAQEQSAGNVPSGQSPPAAQSGLPGKVYVGSNYVDQPRVCDCLPWDACDKCQPTALSN
jgi:hypothetical protein